MAETAEPESTLEIGDYVIPLSAGEVVVRRQGEVFWKLLADRGIIQGLLADGQSFTVAQLQRCLKQQDPDFDLNAYIPEPLRVISAERKARKPSDTLFKAAAAAALTRGLAPPEVLHVGSNLTRDIAPAKKHGFRTALFAGDKSSLRATPEQLKDPATRPDALLTELEQIREIVPCG